MKIRFSCLIPAALTASTCLLVVCTTVGEPKPVRMKIAGIRGNLQTEQMVVILSEEEGNRILPIAVGSDQALAIHLGQHGLTSPRPLTHDLIVQILSAVNFEVEQVVITSLREGTYYADIVLRQGEKRHHLDARPSDAIALSLRVNAPIYSMPELLEESQEETMAAETPSRSEALSWGFTVQSLSPGLAQYFGQREGVLVSDVRKGGPADKSGLQPGDLLLRMEQENIKEIGSFSELLAQLELARNLNLEFLREGKRQTVVLTKEE